MIKGVLFDLDGTLLDTLEDLYQSVNAALAACGFPERTRMEVRSFVGNGVRNLMVRSVPDGEENPKFEECFQKFREHYAVHLNDHTAPYAGIMELLAELKEKGIPTAVVSNKSDAAVKELCRETFGDLVPLAIGESERVKKKPAPDTVIEAAAGNRCSTEGLCLCRGFRSRSCYCRKRRDSVYFCLLGIS